MELRFKDLKKRDVINVVDGRCLGKITDLTLVFPSGVLVGITVPGKKRNWFISLFVRGGLYIEESKIIKIGNDVILVNLKCGDVCEDSVDLNPKKPPSPCSGSPTCESLFGAKSPSNRIDTEDY